DLCKYANSGLPLFTQKALNFPGEDSNFFKLFSGSSRIKFSLLTPMFAAWAEPLALRQLWQWQNPKSPNSSVIAYLIFPHKQLPLYKQLSPQYFFYNSKSTCITDLTTLNKCQVYKGAKCKYAYREYNVTRHSRPHQRFHNSAVHEFCRA